FAVACLDLGVAGRGRKPEDLIRIAGIADEKRANIAEVTRRNAEDVRDVAQIVLFALVQDAIGRGYNEQAFEHLQKNGALSSEQLGDLARIGVVSGDILLGEVEYLAHTSAFLLRHMHQS